MDLDTRARQASHSLREVVGTPTANDHDVAWRPRRPARAVIAAAAVLALLSGGIATITGNDGDDDRTVIAGVGALAPDDPLPRMILDPVPEGMTQGAVEGGAGEGRPGELSSALFGDPDASEPFAGGDLAVAVLNDDTIDFDGYAVPGARPVDVRGTQAATWVTDLGHRRLVWKEERTGARITLDSRSMTPGQLVAVAEALDPTNIGALPGDVLPERVELIAVWADRKTESAHANYDGEGDSVCIVGLACLGVDLNVGSSRSGPAARAEAEFYSPAGLEDVVVRGRDGWFEPGRKFDAVESSGSEGDVTTESELPPSVSWLEREGHLVRLSGRGMGKEELLALAEDVRPATDEEWEALERRGDHWNPRQVTVDEGDTDGIEWSVTVEPFDQAPAAREICLKVPGEPSVCVGLSEPPPGPPPVLGLPALQSLSATSDGYVVWGQVGSDVATVRLELAGSSAVEVPTRAVEGVDGRFYAAGIVAESRELTVVGFDGAGAELGRRTDTLHPGQTYGQRESTEEGG